MPHGKPTEPLTRIIIAVFAVAALVVLYFAFLA